jgi:hypothetical protein
MKKNFPFLLFVMLISGITKIQAQTTYTISSNSSWASASYPSYCNTCTFNISSRITFTLDKSGVTCANCVFSGGNVSITQDFICQSCSFTSENITMANVALNLQLSGTGPATINFSNVNFAVSGTGSITANAPVNITNSLFTFSNSSFFNNNNGTFNLSGSVMNFNDGSYFIANAGPVNLKTTSSMIAGSGSSASSAYIKINGPQLNIYDNSFIALGNINNFYFNWSSYRSVSLNKTYITTPNTLNCGRPGQNSCMAPYVYGPSTLNSLGPITGNVLPIVLADFNASLASNHSVDISWNTQQETNADHFTIERSVNGSNNWEAIGTIEAKGNSSGITYYSFADASPNENNYYRLQMADMDGKETASKVIYILNAPTIEKQISIYPNPITNLSFNLKVSTVEPVIINVFTMEGRMLQTVALKGQLQYQIHLPASTTHNIYLAVQIINNGKTQTLSVFNK